MIGCQILMTMKEPSIGPERASTFIMHTHGPLFTCPLNNFRTEKEKRLVKILSLIK